MALISCQRAQQHVDHVQSSVRSRLPPEYTSAIHYRQKHSWSNAMPFVQATPYTEGLGPSSRPADLISEDLLVAHIVLQL